MIDIKKFAKDYKEFSCTIKDVFRTILDDYTELLLFGIYSRFESFEFSGKNTINIIYYDSDYDVRETSFIKIPIDVIQNEQIDKWCEEQIKEKYRKNFEKIIDDEQKTKEYELAELKRLKEKYEA